MWVEILCGLVVYKLIRAVFFSDDGLDQLAGLDSSHSDLCFAVAARYPSRQPTPSSSPPGKP